MEADDNLESDNKDQFEPAENVDGVWLYETCLETFVHVKSCMQLFRCNSTQLQVSFNFMTDPSVLFLLTVVQLYISLYCGELSLWRDL